MKISFSIFFASFLFALLVSVFFFSCSHDQFAGYEKTESGLYYKFHVKGKDTAHVQYGEVIKVKMIKRMHDSILERTDVMAPDGIQQYIRKGAFNGAIEEGIVMMAVGDSATFLISTDSVSKYYPAKDSSVKYEPHSYFAFDIKLLEIKTMEQVQKEEKQKRKEYISARKEKEPHELSTYIQDNHIDVKPSATGIYYIEKEKGKGASPKDGDSVIVNYTGMFLNGTIFDSSVKRNQPFGFILGTKQVIEGWEQVLKLMKKGASAIIILPSALAYDSTGWIDHRSGKYFIPPYSPMRFEIQLLDIKPKK